MTFDRRKVTITLGFLASFTAFYSIGRFPTGTEVLNVVDGVETLVDSTTEPLGFVLAAAMLISGVLALVGTIRFLRGRRAAPALLAAGIVGLVGVLPGVLSLLAYRLMATAAPRT
ncbi:hypothetical protein QEZ54_01935 [Catellatospora sp. KI3]|uniref:hypothetical protein n=1 Tax=Catellatospora sp. KI3 TaxID=3041620 RepID=UPI0024827734|nr:hypothetical protein [Catellatospora sp. KI3]MDI1459718.1 hypothetical protein [Catellatospora sp. KI3]